MFDPFRSASWLSPQALVARPDRAEAALRTVLVVDDDDAHRELYRTVLEEAGYRVVEASNGVDGLLLARGERPSLIVTDQHMPGLNGWDLLLHVRASEELARTPVLMVTSDTGGMTRARLAGSGLTALMAKPFDVEALMDVVALAAARP